jgi:hypothetical protein
MPSTVDILTKAFAALSVDQKDNLLYHVERGTPILCGDGASQFFVYDGLA